MKILPPSARVWPGAVPRSLPPLPLRGLDRQQVGALLGLGASPGWAPVTLGTWEAAARP